EHDVNSDSAGWVGCRFLTSTAPINTVRYSTSAGSFDAGTVALWGIPLGTTMAFFDFLTGADEAQKASEKATKRAIGFAQQGQDKAAGAVTKYLAPGANYQPIQ